MIRYHEVFNKDTLNIFTDASTKTIKGETLGLPGYVAVVGDEVISQKVIVLRSSTNNQSEIYAIKMAVEFALQHRDKVKVINIFSDSMISIYSLREWVFKWVNNIQNDNFMNSSNKEVSHQSIIMSIIRTILENNLKINLYHNRGHFNPNNKKEVAEFVSKFKEINMLKDDISTSIAIHIMKYNDMIDNASRDFIKGLPINDIDKLSILEYRADNFDINQYRYLLNI